MFEYQKSWESLRIVRSVNRITFTNSRDNEFTEEIVIKNNRYISICDFPLPIADFKHELAILDEDNSTLSIKSREQIINEIETLDSNLKPILQFQFDNEYRLWIVLPLDKPIKSLDTRTVRIKYDFLGKKTHS